MVDREAPGRGASFGNAGHIATEQVFPLASPQVLRGALRYLLDRESPLRIRPAYALKLVPWLARFAWASRPGSFARGVAAICALQESAARDLLELLALANARSLAHLDGHLVLVEQARGLEAAKAEVALMREHGIAAEWLTASKARELAPEIEAPLQGAWRFLATGHVDDPYAVSAALERAVREASGEIRVGEVTALESRGGAFTARTKEGAALQAEHVVLACGAWSRPLAAALGHDVPLDTERGYHITLPAARPAFRIPVASFERKVIMTPMSIGVRMTGTVELGGLRLPPDPRRFEMLERHAKALAPSLPTSGMSTWMGFRPSLPDHLPVLGRPDARNLVFAFGHQHLGLTLAGVTARIVADLVARRDPGLDLAPFSAGRF